MWFRKLKTSHNELPTIFFYDRYPGGIGLSEQNHEGIETVLMETKKMITNCPCEQGCPSCIGTDPTTEIAKQDVLKLLSLFQSISQA